MESASHLFRLSSGSSLPHLLVESVGVEPNCAQSGVEKAVGASDIPSAHAFDSSILFLQGHGGCLLCRAKVANKVAVSTGSAA